MQLSPGGKLARVAGASGRGMEGVATERERRGVVVGEEMQSVRLKEKGELCRIIANYQQVCWSAIWSMAERALLHEWTFHDSWIW